MIRQFRPRPHYHCVKKRRFSLPKISRRRKYLATASVIFHPKEKPIRSLENELKRDMSFPYEYMPVAERKIARKKSKSDR